MRVTIGAQQIQCCARYTVLFSPFPSAPHLSPYMPVYSPRRWWTPHWRSQHQSDYCLPNTKPHRGRPLRKTGWPRRRASNIFLLLALFVVSGWLYVLVRSLAHDSRRRGPFVEKLLDLVIPEEGTKPPLYERYRESEMELSKRAGDNSRTKYVFFVDHMQRKWTLPLLQAVDAYTLLLARLSSRCYRVSGAVSEFRFLVVRTSAKCGTRRLSGSHTETLILSIGAGWGNIMQELLLHAYTAYRLNRTSVPLALYSRLNADVPYTRFVWYDYEWNPDGSRYTFYNGKRMPSRIPLSAFVQGGLPTSSLKAVD